MTQEAGLPGRFLVTTGSVDGVSRGQDRSAHTALQRIGRICCVERSRKVDHYLLAVGLKICKCGKEGPFFVSRDVSEVVLNGQLSAGHFLIDFRTRAQHHRRSLGLTRTPESRIAQAGLLSARLQLPVRD